MTRFVEHFVETTPELPDLYHEMATFIWTDLAGAHCRLGGVMFGPAQDVEQHHVTPIPNSQQQLHVRSARRGRSRPPSPDYGEGPGRHESFTSTPASTTQRGEVGNQWVYSCRSDSSVLPTKTEVERDIGIATETDRSVMWAIFLVMTGFNRPLTLAETVRDIEECVARIGARTNAERSGGFQNGLRVDVPFLTRTFLTNDFELNRNREYLHSVSQPRGYIVKLECQALFGTFYVCSDSGYIIHPAFARIFSLMFPNRCYGFCALPSGTDISKLQDPRYESLGVARNMPWGRDLDTVLNLILFLLYQYLDQHYLYNNLFVIIPYTYYHSVQRTTRDGDYMFLPPSTDSRQNVTCAEYLFEILFLGAPCVSPKPLDTPVFSRVWYSCLGGLREDVAKGKSDATRFCLNVHGFPIEVFDTIEGAINTEDRPPTLEAPTGVYFDDLPDNLLARDAVRLLMSDKVNVPYAPELLLAFTLPRVIDRDIIRNCRLVTFSKGYHMARLDFSVLKSHYGIDSGSKTSIKSIEGYRPLIKLKERAERAMSTASAAPSTEKPIRESFASIVRDIGVKKQAPWNDVRRSDKDFPPLPTATTDAVTRLPRDGSRDVQGELQRHGIQDQNLLEVLSKVVRNIESNMMTRVDQQDQRLKELSDKQDLLAKTTSLRFDMMVQYGISSQVSIHVDRYEDQRIAYEKLSKDSYKSASPEEKAAVQEELTKIKQRARRHRMEAETLAQEAGLDVANRFEDF